MEFNGVMDQPLKYHSVSSCLLSLWDSCHMDKFNTSQGTCEERKQKSDMLLQYLIL